MKTFTCITIDLTLDTYSFDGGYGHNEQNIRNYESVIENMLNSELSDYYTVVNIKLAEHDRAPEIEGLDIDDQQDLVVYEHILKRLDDPTFMDIAHNKAWSM